jgi:hypothetical protein
MIIQNHSIYRLNDDFITKHTNLLNYFNLKNIDVEITDNVVQFETFLKSLPANELGFTYDETFSYTNSFATDPISFFCLLLKNNNEIIGTYAARNLDPIVFLGNFRNHFNLTSYLESPNDYLPSDKKFENILNCFYSSNSWVKSTRREEKLDIFLDHLKKNIIFDVIDGGMNFSVHKLKYKNYHLNDLLYERSEWIGTITDEYFFNGLETPPTIEDKTYNLTWAFKDTWQNKHNETKLLYL